MYLEVKVIIKQMTIDDVYNMLFIWNVDTAADLSACARLPWSEIEIFRIIMQ